MKRRKIWPTTRMRIIRIARGVDQVDLATLSSVTGPAVTQYESNKLCPRPPVRKKIADALGVSAAWLFEEAPAKRGIEKAVDALLREVNKDGNKGKTR